jgi:hypothetical protein
MGAVGGAIVYRSFELQNRNQLQRHGGPLSAENDVGGVVGRLMFGDAVAERWQVDPGKHRFALPEHDRGQSEMQFVDQPGAKILTHR